MRRAFSPSEQPTKRLKTLLKNLLLRRLLKKVQTQGGAPHCGLRNAEWACRHVAAHPLQPRQRGEKLAPFQQPAPHRLPAGCSKRSRCEAARDVPTEAYAGYAAGSARARQRRRWAFFSSLLGPSDGPVRGGIARGDRRRWTEKTTGE